MNRWNEGNLSAILFLVCKKIFQFIHEIPQFIQCCGKWLCARLKKSKQAQAEVKRKISNMLKILIKVLIKYLVGHFIYSYQQLDSSQ
jgi:hypothetical protein